MKHFIPLIVYLGVITITGIVPAMFGYILTGGTLIVYLLLIVAYVGYLTLYYREGTYWIHKENGIVYVFKGWQEYVTLDGSLGSNFKAALHPLDNSQEYPGLQEYPQSSEFRRDYNKISKAVAEDLVEREKGLQALANL